jgi:formylglycine-generating enzyme required for sulfatase activity
MVAMSADDSEPERPTKQDVDATVAIEAALEVAGMSLPGKAIVEVARFARRYSSQGRAEREYTKLDEERLRAEFALLVRSAVAEDLDAIAAVGDEQLDFQTRADERLDQIIELLYRQISTGEPPPPLRPLHELIEIYEDKAAAKHEFVPLLGFSQIRVRLSLTLEDLYVPLHAAYHPGRGADFGAGEQALAQAGDAQHLPLSAAFTLAAKDKRRGLVLLGDPGSGKTTHLKRVLLKVVREGPESIGLPAGTVPVFLPLQALRSLDGGLPAFIHEQLRDPLLGLPGDFGQRLCERGKLLLLFDGLDEVASAKERAKVARFIEDIHASAPDSHVLVSCRYAGYTSEVALAHQFVELHLRPLDDEQMRTFVRNWYVQVERGRELGGDVEQANIRAASKAAELLAVLESSEYTAVAQIYEMTRNPLLLTAICLVHHDKDALPKARAKLYQQCVDVLLERWAARHPQAPLSPDEALDVLQPLAAWMHGAPNRKQASRDELLEPVTNALSGLYGKKIDAGQFLAAIRDEAGLLTGFGVDVFGFMHLGFQEFLAAKHLRNTGWSDPQVFDALTGRFGEAWWQEVILLMLAQRDPDVFAPFMRALVRHQEFVAWSESALIGQCFDEAAKVSPQPFVELLRAPAEGVDVRGLGSRQLAVAKLLARQMPDSLDGLEELLREHPAEPVRAWWRAHTKQERRGAARRGAARGGVQLVLIPSGRFTMDDGVHANVVDLESFYLARTPVTNGQYREFLEAMPKVAKPRYWADRQFNQPEQPVVGVSWDDAKVYCDWAGLVLPTEAQWEYACRAGTTTAYHSGDDEADLARVGWYARNSGGRLRAVAELEPNGFGLYDMHGNVFEWCLDNFGSYKTSPHRGDGLRYEPVGDASRVVRGGCWFNVARFARSAFRDDWHPGVRSYDVGFRPAQGIH